MAADSLLQNRGPWRSIAALPPAQHTSQRSLAGRPFSPPSRLCRSEQSGGLTSENKVVDPLRRSHVLF